MPPTIRKRPTFRFRTGQREEPEPRYNYRISGLDERSLELRCFAEDWEPTVGGLGAFAHFKNAQRLIWPDLEWNPWLESQIRSLCDSDFVIRIGTSKVRFVSWTGCGSAGKTFAAGLFAVEWWLADPFNSCVTLTSTSKEIIGQRVWPVLQLLYQTAKDPKSGVRLPIGHMINHRKMLQPTKGDEKHSISAVAVERGELQNAIDRIKGRHAPRMLLIVDEANSTPTAIFETITNMAKGAEELVVLVIGNAVSRLDNHGRCCEPAKGWPSITVDDEIWRTKGVPEWGLPEGVCVHYDGAKSPNVKVGRTIYPYLYRYENYLFALSQGKQDSPMYWSQDRGFWPPEGISNTVFSETMIDRFDAKGKLTFVSTKEPCAFLDTAFGGDQAILQFGELGDLHDGRMGLQLKDHIEVVATVAANHEIDYQVARSFIQSCKERGVRPEFAGLDATGIGRGVAAIVMQEWSDRVHYIEFGGSASEMPSSEDDPRPSKEVYHNRVAELWYSCRELLRGGQLKGLYHEAIIEFTIRLFEYRARKIALETKEALRERLRRSPDHADAIAGLCEIARRHGAVPGGLPRPQEPSEARPYEERPWESEPSMIPFDESSDEVLVTFGGEW